MKVDAPGQWVVHARVGSYNLYTQSFLSVLLDNGWVSDEVSACICMAIFLIFKRLSPAILKSH